MSEPGECIVYITTPFGGTNGSNTHQAWRWHIAVALQSVVRHRLPIQYFWNRLWSPSTSVNGLEQCLESSVPIQYYIGKKPYKSVKRVGSFKSVEIYDVSEPNLIG